MLRKLVFVGMILVLMASFSVVLADQDGNTCWCNVDKDGCWVTNEEGGKDYIMFWSEESRKFFMGDSTAPFTSVVSKAEGATLGLLCGVPETVITAAAAAPKTVESICRQWVDEDFGGDNSEYNDCVNYYYKQYPDDPVAGAEQEYKDAHSGGQSNGGQPDDNRPS